MEDVDLYNRVREQYTLGEGLLVLLVNNSYYNYNS